MKRRWLVLVVVALVAGACGGSDGDGEGAAATDSAASDAADTNSDDNDPDGSGDGETDTDSDDDGETDTDSDTDSDDGSDAGSGDGSGDGAPRGGLAEAIYRLIVDDPTFDSNTFSEEQAACVANRSVDEVGEDTFAGYGITAETVEQDTLNDIEFAEDDADTLADVFVECGDMMAVMLEGFDASDAEEACLLGAISEDDLKEFMSLNFQGRDDETLAVFSGAFTQCRGVGDDGSNNGVEAGDEDPFQGGDLDDIMLGVLIDTMNLDEQQIGCLEDQMDGGVSLQDPQGLATAFASCGIEEPQ
ncbi:MAG: hypothetical protein ACR2QE_01925 [Acidimicrobiales bacterium]